MFNLASFRYRNVLAAADGPIARLVTSDFVIEGQRVFQANAYLRADLRPARPRRSVYSDADASGTNASPMVARFMAISEAMERWAYFATVKSPGRAAYGFDVDPMSNGMAAFPGLFPRQARRKAYLEAVERFNLIAWWEGCAAGAEHATAWSGIRAVVIGAAAREVTVILHKRTDDGFHAYGHAAAENFPGACRKAVIELARHEYVVRHFWLAKAAVGGGDETKPRDLLERRSVFFASDEGHDEFLRRLRAKPARPAAPRRCVFDGAIIGPWSRYAHVWRVVFEPPSRRFMDDDERYFLW